MTDRTAATATGFAACESPARYIQQLVSHWGHKFATSYDEGDGGHVPVLRRHQRGDAGRCPTASGSRSPPPITTRTSACAA